MNYKPKAFTVGDFIYTLDYDILVTVQKLKDDTNFYCFSDPYSEELQDKKVISSYADKNENGVPVIHLVIDEE